jgi:hypothetical protein
VSKGGAQRKREGSSTEPATSSRVTAAAPRTAPARRTNWVWIVLIVLVLVGLVGGFFVSLVAGTDPTTTTLTPPG